MAGDTRDRAGDAELDARGNPLACSSGVVCRDAAADCACEFVNDRPGCTGDVKCGDDASASGGMLLWLLLLIAGVPTALPVPVSSGVTCALEDELRRSTDTANTHTTRERVSEVDISWFAQQSVHSLPLRCCCTCACVLLLLLLVRTRIRHDFSIHDAHHDDTR